MGSFNWPDKSVFKGHFKDNIIDGKGTYNWEDGKQFIGDWKNN